jgi:ribosome-binding factor A
MSSQRRYPRTARLNEAVLEVLAEELERMNDPRLELVTLTEADVSRDLGHANVYYSAMAASAEADDTAKALASAAPHFQRVLGRELRIRQVPKLVFKVDPGIVAGQRIDQILREIHHGDVEKDEAVPAGGAEEDV